MARSSLRYEVAHPGHGAFGSDPLTLHVLKIVRRPAPNPNEPEIQVWFAPNGGSAATSQFSIYGDCAIKWFGGESLKVGDITN